MVDINPLVVGIPLVAGLIGLLWLGWPREMNKREAKNKDRQLLELARSAQLPEGAVDICIRGAPLEDSDRSGRIMALLIGDFGTGRGEDILTILDRSHMGDAIGSVLAIQGDSRRRQQFLDTIPPAFLDRVVTAKFPALGGGFGNRSPQEVQDLINRWGPGLLQKARQVCEVHEARVHDEASLLLVFVGLGGSATAGVLAVKEILRQHRLAAVYGFTALPVDDLLAMEAEGIFAAYTDAGVQGFVVSSNLQDEVLNDFGMDAAVVGFITGALHSDAATEINNAWRLLFSRAKGNLVSYHTYARTIPGHRLTPLHPLVPPRYYVHGGLLSSAINGALEEVHQDIYHALGGVGLNGQVPLTSQFDIVLAPIAPYDLKPIEDEIVQGQRLKGRDKRNHHLVFSPYATVINPSRILCPLACISLRALHDPPGTLRKLLPPGSKPPRLRGGTPQHKAHRRHEPSNVSSFKGRPA